MVSQTHNLPAQRDALFLLSVIKDQDVSRDNVCPPVTATRTRHNEQITDWSNLIHTYLPYRGSALKLPSAVSSELGLGRVFRCYIIQPPMLTYYVCRFLPALHSYLRNITTYAIKPSTWYSYLHYKAIFVIPNCDIAIYVKIFFPT